MTTGDSQAIKVLQRFYAAEADYMQAGGTAAGASFDAMAQTLDPDVVLHHSPDLPWGGEWHGHQGFEGWSKRMSELNASLEVQDPRFFPDGDTVLVTLTLVTRARTTGTVIRSPMVQQVHIDGERIVDFRAFYWNVPQYLRAYDNDHPTTDEDPVR